MLLVNFPRAGTHLIRHIFMQQLDFDLPVTHSHEEARGKVITVARDPHDAIQSALVMAIHYDEPADVAQLIRYYEDFHSYMSTRADIVVDYNTLLNSPDVVRDHLAQLLGLEYNGKEYQDVTKDKPNEKYLVSSKVSEFYANDYLTGHDLSKAYELYNAMLSRKDI